jgi:hypothetical protein
MKPQELEDRLIDFAVMVIGVVEAMPVSKAGNHIALHPVLLMIDD